MPSDHLIKIFAFSPVRWQRIRLIEEHNVHEFKVLDVFECL
jgi:hypothetical protein